MRLTAAATLLGLAFAAPAFAQTEAEKVEPKKETEKLWRIECTGISG